eukprot:m.904777 g.904777  ORF g.904777 m.904777 type:complete len:438 (+) comp23695_c0_seq51:140-1453(+)
MAVSNNKWYIWAIVLCADTTHSMPPWTWDTIQTYIHCANRTGEWNENALQILATQSFVVFEKMHKVWAQPVNTSAETKIADSCALVKKLNPRTDCYIYTESDWARTWYSLGHWVDMHTTDALQCPEEGDFINTTDVEVLSGVPPINGSKSFTYNFKAYDFTAPTMREAWVQRVLDAVATGHVDGAFIDGNRGGFGSGILGPCAEAKKASWARGLNESVFELARRLGPNRTTISNYPTPDALALCSGGMMERGGTRAQIASWSNKTCGLWGQPCVLDYHAQYADRNIATFNSSITNFLLGVYKYAYFGVGGGWGGDGPTACSSWFRRYPEYKKALGRPHSDAREFNTSYGVAYTREFSSGTKVFAGQVRKSLAVSVQVHCAVEWYRNPMCLSSSFARARCRRMLQYLPPDGRNSGACVFWSDGYITGNASRCPPPHTF